MRWKWIGILCGLALLTINCQQFESINEGEAVQQSVAAFQSSGDWVLSSKVCNGKAVQVADVDKKLSFRDLSPDTVTAILARRRTTGL